MVVWASSGEAVAEAEVLVLVQYVVPGTFDWFRVTCEAVAGHATEGVS